MMRRSGWASAATAAAMLAVVTEVTRVAAAPPAAPDAAKVLLEQAVHHFAEGNLARAKSELERALAVKPPAKLAARAQLYLGLIYAGRGDLPAAKAAFRRAIELDPSLRPDEGRIKPELVQLFDAVRSSLAGDLTVTVAAAKATVSVDGVACGEAPLQMRLMPGPHLVEVRGVDGQLLHRARVEISSGRSSIVAVARPTATTRPSAEAKRSAPRAPPPPPPPRGRLWTWIAGGAAVASTALAIGAGIAARADERQACEMLEAKGDCSEASVFTAGADRATYRDLRSTAQTKATLSNVAWIAAGSLAAATLVLFWFEGRAGEAPRQTRGSGLELMLGGVSGLGARWRY